MLDQLKLGRIFDDIIVIKLQWSKKKYKKP